MEAVRSLGTAGWGWGRLFSMVGWTAVFFFCWSDALAQDQPAAQSSPQTAPQPAQPHNPAAAPPPGNSPTDQPGANQPAANQPAANEKPQDEKKEEKKDDASNPAVEVTKEVAQATKNVGQAALVKARDWERGWFVGIYVQKGRQLVPMTWQQRQDIYLQQTLTTPAAYLKIMLDAGIDQARDSPAQWGEGWGAYGERFASREGQFIAANSLAMLGNAALQYEVRYDQCRCSGFWPRSRHAIIRNFVTYDRSEKELRPQWALYGGAFGGGVISSAWKPHPRNAFAEGGRAMAEQTAWGSLLNLFIEFLPEIDRKIGTRPKKQ